MFPQLDLEMAFAGEEQVMQTVEKVLTELGEQGRIQHLIGEKPWITGEIPRMEYWRAMARYGSDKPDLRLGMEVCSFTLRNAAVR